MHLWTTKTQFAVSTASMVFRMLQIYLNFTIETQSRLRGWVRSFLHRRYLVFRRDTRVSQHTPEKAEEIRQPIAQSTIALIHINDISETYSWTWMIQWCILIRRTITLCAREEQRLYLCVVKLYEQALHCLQCCCSWWNLAVIVRHI